MYYRQFIREIQSGEIRPFYFIFSEDDFLLQEGLKALRQAYLYDQGPVDHVDGKEPVSRAIRLVREGGGLFSSRKVVVMKDPHFLKDKGDEGEVDRVLEYVKKPAADACLVIYVSKVDKRRRFFKNMMKEKLAYDFSPLKGRDLKVWVRERARYLGKELSETTLEYLIMCTGEDMARLAAELQKIVLFMGQDTSIDRKDLERLVSCSFSVSIFALVDLLGEQKKDGVLKLLREILSQGEPPLKILFMISRQLQLLYRARALLDEGLPPRDLPRHMALAPFITQKLSRQVDKFSLQALTRALGLVRDTDHAIKTGKKAPDMALEMLLLKM